MLEPLDACGTISGGWPLSLLEVRVGIMLRYNLFGKLNVIIYRGYSLKCGCVSDFGALFGTLLDRWKNKRM